MIMYLTLQKETQEESARNLKVGYLKEECGNRDLGKRGTCTDIKWRKN